MGNENPAGRRRMNYKIKSVRNEDGGTAYSILACADDVEARRHKRDPWGATFVNIALSSFNQPGADDQGKSNTEVGRREVEIASTNVHVRVELIKCMKDNLAKTTAEAVKHHKSVSRNTKKNGRKGRKNTVEVDEMEERGEERQEADGEGRTQTKEDSSRVFFCEETYERLKALNLLPPSDNVVEPIAAMPVNLGLQQVADSLEGLSCPNFLSESDNSYDLEKEAGETLESVVEKLFPSGVFTAPSAANGPEAAEQLVDLSPFEHLILPVTKHLTLGEIDEEVSIDGEGNESFQSHDDSVTADRNQQHSIFEKEAFYQWLKDEGDRRLQKEARPKVNETEAHVSTIIAPSRYQLAALEEQSEKTSAKGSHINPHEELQEELPFTEEFDPVEQFEQETIDPASPHNLEAEAERLSGQNVENIGPPSKTPRFTQDQPFRPQFKQRKKFAALNMIIEQPSELPLEEDPSEVNPEGPSEASRQCERAHQTSNPIRPSFKPLRSSRLLERLEEAIQNEEENFESLDVEDKENYPPGCEEDEQEHKSAASPKQEALGGRFEKGGGVDVSSPRSKKKDRKGAGSTKKLNRSDLVIAISDRDVHEAKRYQRRPLGKQKMYKPVKDFEQLLMAPEPESASFHGYADESPEDKPLLPELVLEPDMFNRALSRPIDDFHQYRKLLLTDPFKLPGCFKPDGSAEVPVGNDGELPDTPPPAPSWPAPWNPERLDRRANPAEGEASLDAAPRDAYVNQQGTEEEVMGGPGLEWQEDDLDNHFDAVSGSPPFDDQPSATPGDDAPQLCAQELPAAPPGDSQVPWGGTPVGDKQLIVAGRKRYRLEQMVAEAVEAERRARQERLKRQDLGPLSAALLEGLGDAHREGRQTSAGATCATMGQLAQRCFGREKLSESADASPHRCFVALLHVATQHNIGGSQASSLASCSIRLQNPGSKIEDVTISIVPECS